MHRPVGRPLSAATRALRTVEKSGTSSWICADLRCERRSRARTPETDIDLKGGSMTGPPQGAQHLRYSSGAPTGTRSRSTTASARSAAPSCRPAVPTVTLSPKASSTAGSAAQPSSSPASSPARWRTRRGSSKNTWLIVVVVVVAVLVVGGILALVLSSNSPKSTTTTTTASSDRAPPRPAHLRPPPRPRHDDDSGHGYRAQRLRADRSGRAGDPRQRAPGRPDGPTTRARARRSPARW